MEGDVCVDHRLVIGHRAGEDDVAYPDENRVRGGEVVLADAQRRAGGRLRLQYPTHRV